MHVHKHFFDANSALAQGIKIENPDFVQGLSRQQTPEYFWIGCSDSRVPACDIAGRRPGHIFMRKP